MEMDSQLGEERKVGCPKSPKWESEGDLGRKTKVCLLPHLTKATCAMMRCTSSGCMGPVTRSHFSCGLGVGKGGTKLPRGLDMLCQEMNEAW